MGERGAQEGGGGVGDGHSAAPSPPSPPAAPATPPPSVGQDAPPALHRPRLHKDAAPRAAAALPAAPVVTLNRDDPVDLDGGGDGDLEGPAPGPPAGGRPPAPAPESHRSVEAAVGGGL